MSETLVEQEQVRETAATLPTVAIVGLGYVGLPVAVAFARERPTIGYDLSARRVENLRHKVDATGEVSTAELLAASVSDPAALNQAYNVAVGEQTSLSELFEMIRAILIPRYPQLRTVRPVHREERRGDIKFSKADIGKAKRLLGYRPDFRVMEGLERTIDWYVANLSPVEPQKQVAHA